MATSVKQIIDVALRKFGALGTGASADPNEYADALHALKMMLDGWSLEALMVPFSATEQFDLSQSRAQYTMGTLGDWNTVRPQEIEFVRVVDAGGVKHVVTKSDRMILQWQGQVEPGRPTRYLVSQDARFVSIEFDCYPTDPHVLITSRKPFNAEVLDNFDAAYDGSITTAYPSGFTMTGIQTEIAFPTGYEQAIIYNLAVHLAPEYPGLVLPDTVVALAISAKRNIKRSNWQPVIMMPEAGVTMNRRGSYDIEVGP